MSKWLSNELIEDIGTEILHHRPGSVFRPDSDEYVRSICAQAREANRLRNGLEVLQKDVEVLQKDVEVLYLRISELLEGEE